MDEIQNEIRRPVVEKLLALMEFRNSHKAFHLDGECIVETEGSRLVITRSYGLFCATLKADLKTFEYEITCS